MNPFIVTEMIVYNEEKYIRYSIGAIYNHVDHIVITDSFSTDSTIDIIKRLDVDHKITILQRKWTNDYAAQRNAGLDFIKTNIYPKHPDNMYLLRVDADEVYYESCLSKLNNTILQNPNASGFRFNFYTFDGSHTTLSEKNPIENRVCLFKYSPEITYISPLHEMPVIPIGNNFRPLYTHNPSQDAELGIVPVDGFAYCHFSWSDKSKCLDKAIKYTERYVVQGSETQERLNSIKAGDEWWWEGHKSNLQFNGEYPEIFDKIGELDNFKKGAKLPQKITNGKFLMVDGELTFYADEVSQNALEESSATKLTGGQFVVRDGKLVFDSEEPIQTEDPAKVEEPQPKNDMLDQKGRGLSAFTIVKNAIKYDYPIVESINSVLPFVDEYIINVGMPDEDGTKALLQQHFGSNPKVKMFDSVWEGRDQGIKFLTSQTNLAKDACSNEWGLYVQADELYLAEDFSKIRQAIEACVNYPHILGFAFNFLHFDGDYASVNPTSYPREIRLVRRNAVASIHDAVTFGVKAFSNTPLMQMDKMFAPLDVRVFHYGWVKQPEKMLAKLRNFDGFYHNDAEWETMHGQDHLKFPDGKYDYDK